MDSIASEQPVSAVLDSYDDYGLGESLSRRWLKLLSNGRQQGLGFACRDWGATGLLVQSVATSSAEHGGGLKPGDTLVDYSAPHLGNRWLSATPERIRAAYSLALPGERLKLHILRHGEHLTIDVALP